MCVISGRIGVLRWVFCGRFTEQEVWVKNITALVEANHKAAQIIHQFSYILVLCKHRRSVIKGYVCFLMRVVQIVVLACTLDKKRNIILCDQLLQFSVLILFIYCIGYIAYTTSGVAAHQQHQTLPAYGAFKILRRVSIALLQGIFVCRRCNKCYSYLLGIK